MRTFPGEKLFVGGGEAENIFRKTFAPPFCPMFATIRPVKWMSARPETVLSGLKNRLQQDGRSFGADCMAVFTCYKRLYNGKVNYKSIGKPLLLDEKRK